MRRAASMLAFPLLLTSLPLASVDAPAEDSGPFTKLDCPLLRGVLTGPLEVCNVRATAEVGPANEIDLAMDPQDPAHMVLVAKGYNYTRLLDSTLAGGVITPYAATFDGGSTWHQGTLQPLDQVQFTLPVLGWDVGETSKHDSDPVVTFAKDGTVVANTLRISGGSGLPVFRSADGGRTFVEAGRSYTGGTDKNWIATDPLTGNIYVATLHQGGVGFVVSKDHGLTWSAPKRICDCRFPGIDVGPAGEIHISGYGSNQVWFTRSLDFGATWSPQVSVAEHNGLHWNTYNMRLFRTPNIPQLASSHVDGGVFITWAGQPPGTLDPPCVVPLPQPVNPGGGCPATPNHDVYLVRSTDGGLTWSAPVRINDDLDLPVSMQFMSQVAVSPNGRDVHVAWMDQRFDPTGLTAVAMYAHSPDGGLTWEPNLLLSDAPFATALAHHQSSSNLAFVGDYIGLQASDERAVIAFPDTRYGRSDAFVATVV